MRRSRLGNWRSRGIGIAVVKRRLAGLIPKRHAGIIVLALVPTHLLVIGIFVGRHPAPMLDGHADAGVEDDRIVDVPAIGFGVAANDPPLVGPGAAEIRRVAGMQSPRHEKIILRPRAPDGRRFFAVNINFFVALAKPCRAARAHGKDGADVMAAAFGVKDQVILSMLRPDIPGGIGRRSRACPRGGCVFSPNRYCSKACSAVSCFD